jgi:hypothetical protein
MFCPQCQAEYDEPAIECPECHTSLMHHSSGQGPSGVDLDILIRTGITHPIAIGLVKSLLKEAGIPFFPMDQNPAARQESGNVIGWWSVRVPREKEAEAREIVQSVEDAR